MTQDSSVIIEHMTNWVRDIIVKHNICPFAKKELERETIHYSVVYGTDLREFLEAVNHECIKLDNSASVETTLVIFPDLADDFDSFLDLIDYANDLLEMQDYVGVYQLAHMHPKYCFDGLSDSDAANYTNRSPYPTLHIIREDSMARVLKLYPNPEQIPERNITFLREKGIEQVRTELNTCFKVKK